MLLNKIQVEKTIYWFGYLIAILLVYRFIGELDFSNNNKSIGIYQLINSDSITLYQYCSDILSNPSMYKYWNLGTCWLLFPNALLMIIWILIPVGPTMAHCLFGASQILILLILLSNLFQRINLKNKLLLFIGCSFVLLHLIYSILTNNFIYSPNLLQPYHTGAVLAMLLGLIILFSLITKPSIYKAIVFAIITILSIISNNIFIVYLSAPLAATLFVLWLSNKNERKTYATLFIINIFACVIGYYIFRKLIDWRILTISTSDYFNTQTILASFKILLSQYQDIATEFSILGFLVWLSIIGFIGSILFSIKSITKKDNQQIPNTIKIFSIFIFFLTCAAFLAPALVGRYEDYFCVRYNVFLLWILPFTALLYIDFLLKKVKKRILIWNIVAASLLIIEISTLFIGWDKNKPLNVPQSIISFCPKEVSALDKLAKKHHLKRGIGSYWVTKLVNLYSKEKLQANSVFSSLTLFHHANTTYGTTFENENPQILSKYNYIILSDFNDTTQIHKLIKPEQLYRETIDGQSFYITPDFTFSGGYGEVKVTP